MFVFRVSLASFDDEKKIFFMFPDQQALDESGKPPFSEKQLCAHTVFKQFIKDTKTSIVDVSYELFKTDTAINESINDEEFNQLLQNAQAEKLESNDISITTGKQNKALGGGKSNNLMMYGIIAGAVILVIILIIVSAVAGKSDDESSTSDVSEVSSEISDESSDTSSDAESVNSDNSEYSDSSDITDSDYVDTPPNESDTSDYTDIPPQETNDSGYTTGGYSGNSGYTDASDNIQSEYTISFHANGGEGTLDSIKSAPEQYVVLPSAADVGDKLTKEGYKLIGFSDNVEINYPLYDYKMPYSDVTLYAVWEPQEYTVTYNSNGGTGQLSSVKVKYGDSVPMPTEIAVYRDNLNLAGWHTDKAAKTALQELKMPAENLTLYAVWSEKKPTSKVTFHYDDNIMVRTVERGVMDMRQDFGISKDGYIIAGWYLQNSPDALDYLTVSQDVDVYAKWERATYITITVDQSYLNKSPLKYKLTLDMNGEAKLTLPKVNDRSDPYKHVFGCTYGYSTKKQSGEYGVIEYYDTEESTFTRDTTLYRVLNKYGGGKGTEKEPYIINYYDQLLYLAGNKASGYFVQTSDIKFPNDVPNKSISTVKISQGYENKYYDLFVYDGGNYTISNLKESLFGTLAASTIKNVRIDGAMVVSSESDAGILCNSVTSYSFTGSGGNYATGNTLIQHCAVTNSYLTVEDARNAGAICGNGGYIKDCLSQGNTIQGTCSAMGGIAGNACTISGCLSVSNSASGGSAIGGIAGTAHGKEIYEYGNSVRRYGGDISGCGVVSFICSNSDYCGGVVGLSCGIANAYIRSCYVAGVYLNGVQNGGISGGDDNENYDYIHTIAYCVVDETNNYPSIGGEPRSLARVMVLSVPESGLKVDGILAVLNAAGSGFTEWQRDTANSSLPYPKLINDILGG